MPEYLSPGVYIKEIERGPRPIEGLPTSTAAFLGETERGPITPRLVTSFSEYKRWFGDAFGNGDRYMPQAANGFFENGGKRLYVCRVVGQNATTASLTLGSFTLRALEGGAWGNRIWAAMVDGSARADGTPGFRLKVAYWSVVSEAFEPFDPFLPDNSRRLPRPTLTEDFDDLSLDEQSRDHYRKRLDGLSSLVTLEGPVDDEPTRSIGALMIGGANDPGGVGVDDFVGRPVGARSGVQGLEALKLDAYREVALVHAPHPPKDAVAVARALVEHCELQRFCFAIVDGGRNQTDAAASDPRSVIGDSSYAAIYQPWLWISEAQSAVRTLIPPGGYVAGVYSRTDTERGVFKAPANEIVRGALDLEFAIDDGEQQILNSLGINVIRNFPGRGIRVWGTKTLSSDSLWKYVSMRRLFIFLENSIYQGTQWVVFEPNDERLWDRVKDTIRLFLRNQWRVGALLGSTEQQAFFITCDRTTMTQDDLLNGRLVCEIGIAPVRQAEFVIFRIFQNTAEAHR